MLIRRAASAVSSVRNYTYRSQQAVSSSELGRVRRKNYPRVYFEDFDRELKILEEAVTFLPPIKDLNISNYVPENLRNNVYVNNEPLYFGARRLQKQADVGVEIKFNLNEAKWLSDELKQKILEYDRSVQIIDIDGNVVIQKHESQFQDKNLKIALKGLEKLIKECQQDTWRRRVDGHRERKSQRQNSLQKFRSLNWVTNA